VCGGGPSVSGVAAVHTCTLTHPNTYTHLARTEHMYAGMAIPVSMSVMANRLAISSYT